MTYVGAFRRGLACAASAVVVIGLWACTEHVVEVHHLTNDGGEGDPSADDRDGDDGANADETNGDAAAKDAGMLAAGDASHRTDGGLDAGGDASCVSTFTGTALVGTYGRMDGHLVAIVPSSGPAACRGDAAHLHLQVRMNSVVYDVAVNLDTYLAETNAPMPGGAWAEGWHATAAPLDYPTALGLHSADFAATTPSALEASVSGALSREDELSIFATPYDTTGAHDVHRRGGADGAIFVAPTGAAPAHVLAFRFATDAF